MIGDLINGERKQSMVVRFKKLKLRDHKIILILIMMLMLV